MRHPRRSRRGQTVRHTEICQPAFADRAARRQLAGRYTAGEALGLRTLSSATCSPPISGERAPFSGSVDIRTGRVIRVRHGSRMYCRFALFDRLLVPMCRMRSCSFPGHTHCCSMVCSCQWRTRSTGRQSPSGTPGTGRTGVLSHQAGSPRRDLCGRGSPRDLAHC